MLKTVLKDLLFSNQGQGMTEYGLILGVFVAVIIGALVVLGPKVTALYSNTNNLF